MSETHIGAPEPVPEPELFVEFANTAPVSRAGDFDAAEAELLAAWMREHELGPLPDSGRLQRELPAFRELRELVQTVAARVSAGRPPSRRQLTQLNRVLRDGVHYHALRPDDDGARFSMEPVGDQLDQARAAVAGSLAHYLAEHDLRRLRVCDNETCRWLFVDRSPAGRRRWCDMRVCGNRAKVARHRARTRRRTRGSKLANEAAS